MKKLLLIITICFSGISIGSAQEHSPLLDSVVGYYFITPKDSSLSSRYIYRYNQERQQIYYDYSVRYDNQWHLVVNQEKEYDSGGNPVRQIDHETQEQGLGNPYVKQEWDYDSNGYTLSWHKYYKNEDLQSWIPDSMAEYKNSQNGTLIQKLFYKWNNQDWAPSKLYTYSYNIFGLQTEVLFASWSVNSNTWDTYRKDENTYTDGGILLSEYSYFWNSTLNNWVRRSDILTEYDSLGRIKRHVSSNIGASQISQYDYDPSGNFTILLANTLPWLMTFKPSIKFEIIINERRQRISEIMFRLIDSVWTLNNKSEYFYNSSGALSQSSHYNWHPENNDWMLSSRSHYYYNAHLTTVRNICLEEIDIFPNPTADIINITGLSHPAEVRLFSIQGQLLKTVHQVESTIDVSDLPTGVYFVNLTTGMESVVRKIVIDR